MRTGGRHTQPSVSVARSRAACHTRSSSGRRPTSRRSRRSSRSWSLSTTVAAVDVSNWRSLLSRYVGPARQHRAGAIRVQVDRTIQIVRMRTWQFITDAVPGAGVDLTTLRVTPWTIHVAHVYISAIHCALATTHHGLCRNRPPPLARQALAARSAHTPSIRYLTGHLELRTYEGSWPSSSLPKLKFVTVSSSCSVRSSGPVLRRNFRPAWLGRARRLHNDLHSHHRTQPPLV